ncbi:MAG: ribose 5-phosphate isomerase B [Elusimicrobia bacterium]|nr:ribose 5-phosphate isomerase B [Elusimicrobiota bacterium]
MQGVGIGCDHAGFRLKGAILRALARLGFEALDFGIYRALRTDYPRIAHALAQEVSRGKLHRGILVCGTGIGMSIVANKFRGVRAAEVWNPASAHLAAEHNHANVLCFSGRLLRPGQVAPILKAWLRTPYGKGRHRRRVRQIQAIERRLCRRG